MDPDVELIYKEFEIPSRRLQAEWRKGWIEERVGGILPGLMDESGVEFWVLSQKEYDEDVVVQPDCVRRCLDDCTARCFDQVPAPRHRPPTLPPC